MTDTINPCTFRCATHLEHLSDIRAFVESSCQTLGIDEHCCFQLTLAIDEACTNIIKHGHHEAELAPSQIDLSLHREENTITVTIIDYGRSYDPAAILPPDLTGDWRTRRVGGLGWYFIQQISDEVHYQPSEQQSDKQQSDKQQPNGQHGNTLTFRVTMKEASEQKDTGEPTRELTGELTGELTEQ